MNQRSRFCGLGVLAAFTVVATLLCGRAMGESGRDLLLASEGTPGLGSILGPGGENPCDKAHTAFEAIPGAEGKLKAAQARLASAQSEEKAALSKQKSGRAEAEKKLLAAEKKLADMRKNRAGKKFGSALELIPERSEFLRKLEEDIRQTESVAGQLGQIFVRSECPRGTSADVCGGAERDQRQLLGNVNRLVGARLKILKDLKACVNRSLRFFECRPANVSCPASGVMNGVSLGGARAEFDRAYKSVTAQMKMSGNDDVCRITREAYEASLQEYRKKYAGTPETPEERRQSTIKTDADAELARLDAELKPATEKTAAAVRDVAELKEELAELEREYAAQGVECSKEACSPEIKMRQADWEISAVPEMPAILASAPGGGEWTFQASWHYNTVHCDYPASPTPFLGRSFDIVQYAGGGIFGGAYSLKFQRQCGADKKIASRKGKIAGANPSPEEIKQEIDRVGGANAGILKKIACQESSMRQFLVGTERKCAGEKGMPYACNEKDIGIFQVRDASPMREHCRAAWDWRRNVYWGAKLFSDKGCTFKGDKAVAGACYHNQSETGRLGDDVVNPALKECVRKNMLTGYAPEALSKIPKPLIRYIEKIELTDKRNAYLSKEYVQILKQAAYGTSDVLELKKQAAKLGVSKRLMNLIDLVRDGYAISEYNLEAVRRYNGGREYGYDIPYGSEDCLGEWRPHPERVTGMGKPDLDKAAYVISTLSQDSDKCYK